MACILGYTEWARVSRLAAAAKRGQMDRFAAFLQPVEMDDLMAILYF